jgi:amidase
VGVVRSLAGFHEGVDANLERAVDDLAAAGAEVVDNLEFPEAAEDFEDAAYDLLLMEFKHDLNTYLAGISEPAGERTLQSLIEFNRQHVEQEMKWFRQEIFVKAQEADTLESDHYRETLARVQDFSRAAIDNLLEEHQLDLLVAPTDAPAWSIDLIDGDHFLGGSSSMPARAGYPHITVPMGFVHGLPVGLSFFSTAWSEPVLIEAAYGYEQATGRARPPQGFGDWRPAVSE